MGPKAWRNTRIVLGVVWGVFCAGFSAFAIFESTRNGDDSANVSNIFDKKIHGEDIGPAPSLRDMTEGMLGHKARQAALGGEGWRSEVPLQLRLPIAEDAELLLSGRMDAFLDGDVPVVEEIKLWQSREAPGCALTAGCRRFATATCSARSGACPRCGSACAM